MKVLFVANQFFFFRHIDTTASSLVQHGHQVVLWFGNVEKKSITDRAIQDFVKRGAAQYRRYAPRKNGWQSLTGVIRDLLGYRVYLKPGFTSPSKKDHCFQRMSWLPRLLVGNKVGEKILSMKWTSRFLHSFLYRIPVNRKIVAELRDEAPDVLVVVSNLPWEAPELEYLKAGFSMGIPTAIMIASWDNLTTKSAFHIIPDAVILWNKALQEEALILHDVPKDKIIIAGAAAFDYIFELEASCTHGEFCRKLGFAEDKPIVVYLGSSFSIAGDETAFVRQFVQHMRECLDAYVLIRPHPLNHSVWTTFDEPGSVVWPRAGDFPDVASARQDFWDTLRHSAVIVGINTSAMLEAAIGDKPCITIKSEQFRSSQSEDGHFRHLLNGGFLEIAEDFEHAIRLVKNIIEGADRFHENRRAFVASFIRPNGINSPVGSLMTEILERLYQKQDPCHIQNQISLKQ